MNDAQTTTISFAEAIRAVRDARTGDASSDRHELVNAYHAAAEAAANADEVRALLCDDLIPDCVLLEERERAGVRHSLRAIVSRTLRSLPDDVLLAVRPAAIDVAATLAAAHPSEHAIYATSSIEFRAPAIVAALREIGAGGGGVADVALRVMAATRVEGPDLAWLAARVQARLTEGVPSDELLNALATLALPGSIASLGRYAARRDGDWFAFARLGWLCDHAPGDADEQDAIARAMLDAINARANGWSEAMFTGGSLERCRSSAVVAAVAQALDTAAIGADPHGLAHRLRGFRDPSHTAPILRAAIVRPRLDHLRAAATGSTGPSSPDISEGSLAKAAAWYVAMHFASPTLYQWIDEAVSSDENAYSQLSLMETLAILAVPALPRRATELLSDPTLAFSRDREQDDLLPFLGAATLASSKADLGSLRLLMGCAGFYDGSPLRAPVDGAAELAAWLCGQRVPGAFEVVLGGLRTQSPMALSVSLTAIRHLAAAGEFDLVAPALPDLRRIADDVGRRSYLRADAITSLAMATPSDASGEMRDSLSGWLRHTERRIRFAATEAALANRQTMAWADAIATHVLPGAVATPGDARGVWRTVDEQEAFLLGRLAVREPTRFGDAAAAVVSDALPIASLQLIRGLGLDARTVPSTIVDAIVARIRHEDTIFRSSAYLLSALASFAPVRLIGEPWELLFDGWMPDSRRALADALLTTARTLDAAGTGRAAALAERLLGDGDYSVRRSAARAMALVDLTRLKQLCEAWIASGSPSLRVRAAEASTWLPADDDRTIDNALQRTLRRDPERRVREAADAARDGLQRRLRAAAHRAALTAPVDGDANEWVLGRVATASAISRDGDELDHAAILSASYERARPPNVRRFLKRTAEDLDKHWKEAVRKWPGPSRPWQGRTERLEGRLRIGERSLDAVIWLWLDTAGPDDRFVGHRWGGAAFPSDPSAGWQAHFGFARSEVHSTIEIAGRGLTRIDIVGINGNEFTFRGDDEYPPEADVAR